MADVPIYPDEFYKDYNPGQGTVQNSGITPEMYAAWRRKKGLDKANAAKADKAEAAKAEKAAAEKKAATEKPVAKPTIK
jgi:hypothetical protein